MKNLIVLGLISIFSFSCSFNNESTNEKDHIEITKKEEIKTTVTETPIFIIVGRTIDINSKEVSGVTISIVKGDSIIYNDTTTLDGKLEEIELECGAVYFISYSKTGYVTKSIVIDAKTNYLSENIDDLTVFPADITMLRALPNINYSLISNQPVARVQIDTATGGLDYDRQYISKRGKEISRFLEEIIQ